MSIRSSIARRHSLGVLLLMVAVTAGCGGGNSAAAGSPPPPPPPPPPDMTLSVAASLGGSVTSAPNGIDCGGNCSATYPAGTSVTLTAQPASGYAFEQWTGACSGAVTSCTVALSQAESVNASFVPVIPAAGGPFVYYTDTLTGPITGGEGNAGGYLSIFGVNFGSASALGAGTKVYIGGVEVGNYRYLGAAKVGSKLGLQQLTVQVGNLGNPALGTALPIRVVVNGVASNVSSTFTPCAGRILFVSLTGNDATAAAGDITKPWRYMQNQSASTGAYFASKAGDQIVVRGGNWSDTNGWDDTWMRAASNANARNGTAKAWIHITAYPGPINGNAIEDVHYSTPTGKRGGIEGPWSAIAGTSGEYFSVSNLRMDVSAAATSDAAPINLQYTVGHWRVVNNELGPWPVAGVPDAKAAGVAGYGTDVKVLGNHIHHIAGTAALENHGIYADTTASNWEIAHNWIHDITGGSLVQLNDAIGGAGTYQLPDGSVWPGFNGMRIHHNWLENAAKYGIIVGDPGANAGKVELQAWNNVIIGTKLPPIRMKSSATSMDITFAYNTIHNAMTTNSGSGNGYFRNEWNGSGSIRVYNNILSFASGTVTGTTWFFDYSGTSSGWTFKNNLYWDAGRGVDPIDTDTTAVTADPKFANATGGDFSLAAGSPAVDKAAQTIPFTIVDDFTGQSARPSGSANDIGAFERIQ